MMRKEEISEYRVKLDKPIIKLPKIFAINLFLNFILNFRMKFFLVIFSHT